MMAGRNQLGFTLIEVTLVMAISAALLTVVLAGQDQIRSRAEFNSAVEQVATDINQVRGDAQSAVQIGQTSSPGTGAGAGETFFGNLIAFVPGSGSITVMGLYTTVSGGILSPNLTVQTTSTFLIPWGAYINPAIQTQTQYLVFHPSSISDKLLVYTPAMGTTLAQLESISNISSSYNETPAPYNPAQIGMLSLPVIDSSGHKAIIMINGTTGGSVTETFQ